TPSCCRRSTPIMAPSSRVALPPVRRWPHSRRKSAVPYAKKCGATWLTPAGRSRRKRNIELPAADVKRAVGKRPQQLGFGAFSQLQRAPAESLSRGGASGGGGGRVGQGEAS